MVEVNVKMNYRTEKVIPYEGGYGWLICIGLAIPNVNIKLFQKIHRKITKKILGLCFRQHFFIWLDIQRLFRESRFWNQCHYSCYRCLCLRSKFCWLTYKLSIKEILFTIDWNIFLNHLYTWKFYDDICNVN